MAFTHGRRAYEDDDEPMVTPKAQTQPEIPPCKYPVGTVFSSGLFEGLCVIRRARLSWCYDYESVAPRNGRSFGGDDAPEGFFDRQCTVVPPDPYQVGTSHVVDAGVLGRGVVCILAREGDSLTFSTFSYGDGGMKFSVTLAEFEKAVVK
jgi:hypothetical protein